MLDDEIARRRWHDSQRITAGLLVAWFGVTFGVAFFARELGGRVGGWPFSFWVAAQGAPLVYVALTWAYARMTHRLDEACGATQDD
jgi:putative solute:sodium symporter small subunit